MNLTGNARFFAVYLNLIVLILMQPQPYANMQSSVISMPRRLILIFLGVSNNSHSNIILSRIAVLHMLAHTATSHLVTHTNSSNSRLIKLFMQ